ATRFWRAVRAASEQRAAPRAVSGFVLEQRALERQPAAVTRQRAVRADHPMAGHDQADRIRAVRGADAARGCRAADRACDVGIAARLAVRNRQQGVPHGVLKRRARRGAVDVELRALAGAVLVDLTPHVRNRGLIVHRFRVDGRSAVGAQVETHEPAAVVYPRGELREAGLDRAPTVLRSVHAVLACLASDRKPRWSRARLASPGYRRPK